MRFLFVILTFSPACGPSLEPRAAPESAWEEMLERGRLHRFMPRQPLDSLALVGHTPEIHRIQQLGESPYASWIQFDIRLMPDLSEDELAKQLPAVAARYGSILSDLKASEWFQAERFMRRDEGRVYLNYERRVDGLEVRDNVLQLIFVAEQAGAYRLSEVQSNITGPAPRTREAALMQDDEAAAWLQDLTGRSDAVIESMNYEWIPFAEAGQFHWQKALVYEWRFDDEHFQATLLPDEAVWLDAWSLTVHAKPIFTRALKRSYAEDGPRDYPLSFSAAHGTSGNLLLGAEAWLPAGFTPTKVGLTGPRAMIYDNQATEALTVTGLQETGESFFLPEDGTRLAAVNAFVAVQRINRYARQFLTEEDVPFLGEALVVNVNLAEQSCNAFYSPKQQKMLLYKEGKGCANMALLNDVIYHEWGHAFDDHVGRHPGIRDPAFSEGLADVVAAYYNSDPEIAPYFVFDDPSPIRNLESTRRYPDDVGPMHYEGGIIASTFWDLRQSLMERYGATRGAHLAARLFFRHLLAVDSYLESYAAVLRVDDDDGNPATLGPNHCLINTVFARHGLAAPETCEDANPVAAEAATSLHLALLDAGPEDNAVHVLASAPIAEAMALCLGTRADCEANPSVWIPLQAIGQHPDRSFFMSASPLLLPSLTALTLMRLDGKAGHVDSRELKIFAK